MSWRALRKSSMAFDVHTCGCLKRKGKLFMDLVGLRKLLSPLIEALKDAETHERLGSLCERLGLPPPDSGGSKRERMRSSLAALPDSDLPKVAINLVEFYPPEPNPLVARGAWRARSPRSLDRKSVV